VWQGSVGDLRPYADLVGDPSTTGSSGLDASSRAVELGDGAVIVRELRLNESNAQLGIGHSVTIRIEVPMPTVNVPKLAERGLPRSH
jgi:hypothetical protein